VETARKHVDDVAGLSFTYFLTASYGVKWRRQTGLNQNDEDVEIVTSVIRMQSSISVLFSSRAQCWLWSPYIIGQTIIFSSCFFLLSSSFFFFSPNLSGRRLDVYHTLAHGVALVRI